jgi:hypothetical protein
MTDETTLDERTETIETPEQLATVTTLRPPPEDEAPAEAAAPFNPILKVWREVLKPARTEAQKKPTPQWCSKMVQMYQLSYKDCEELRDRYFAKIEELDQILLDEIALDDECLTYATPEEDAEHNSQHYKDLLTAWQLQFLEWELDWNCEDANAAVEIAANSEVHKMFFSNTGLVAFLDNIRFEFTEADQVALSEAINKRKDEAEAEYAALTGEGR